MLLHSLSFKEALAYLGIQRERTSDYSVAKKKDIGRKRDLVSAFRRWERNRRDELATFIRIASKILIDEPITWEMAQNCEEIMHQLNCAEYHFEILCSDDDEQKFELYKEETRYAS